MGIIKHPPPVKLIIGLISGKRENFILAEKKLSEKFGLIDFRSDIFRFDHTDYYQREMGKELERKFITFKNLIQRETLSDIKIYTNGLEKEISAGDSFRHINIDPGYLAHEKLILATTKNYTHRVYLRDGIYADLTLRYEKGSFRSLEWTYPDYKIKSSIEMFHQIRKEYLKQVKAVNRESH